MLIYFIYDHIELCRITADGAFLNNPSDKYFVNVWDTESKKSLDTDGYHLDDRDINLKGLKPYHGKREKSVDLCDLIGQEAYNKLRSLKCLGFIDNEVPESFKVEEVWDRGELISCTHPSEDEIKNKYLSILEG